MESSILAQTGALTKALFTGALFALFYDLLRPVRGGAGRLGSALLDALFCLVTGFAAFLYAMGAGEGRLGICELFFMLIGAFLYIYLLGDRASRFLSGILPEKMIKKGSDDHLR